jgi:hypothetical protein
VLDLVNVTLSVEREPGGEHRVTLSVERQPGGGLPEGETVSLVTEVTMSPKLLHSTQYLTVSLDSTARTPNAYIQCIHA